MEHLHSGGPPIAITILLAWLSGAALGPALLPWLPGRGFAFKGLMAGILGLLAFPAACLPLHLEPLDLLMALTIIPAVSSFLTVVTSRFITGAALSSLREEMQRAFPLQAASVSMAIGIWGLARFI